MYVYIYIYMYVYIYNGHALSRQARMGTCRCTGCADPWISYGSEVINV